MSYVRKAALFAAVTLMTVAASPTPDAGLAMRAEPKYKPGFQAVGYANPDAPKGGTLVIGEEGTFDTLNPFSIKGDAATSTSMLVFQSLAEATLDEPFSKYPGVAESFDLPADRMSLTVTLRSAARFSDGTPVTAEDVVFSFKTFRSDKVQPFYNSYWADIKDAQVVDARTVRFVFAKENPELPLIATEMPVLPKHVYGNGDFGADFATRAVGSGPYEVKDFHAGSAITYKRNPNWWGKDLGIYKGRYNFDEVTYKYYKDLTAMTEGFKRGDFDVYDVRGSKVWALDLVGDKIDKLHYIQKELLPNADDQGAQGFVFNLRNPLFQDARVRQALALAFDFDWSNKNLFYNQYKPTESYFENSPLKAKGLPTPPELAVLEPLRADIPAEVFTKEMGWLGKGKDIKSRLREAVGLLKDAGYTVKDGVAQGPAGRLEFKVLLNPGGFQRIIEPYTQNLRKLGAIATIEEKEESVYIKRVESREFDMIVATYAESQSPGNEQRDFWSSQAADISYSRNYAGIKSKAVDALVDKIIYAKSRDELELMTHCLDRVLYHLHPMVLNWYSPSHRVAAWSKFGRPAKLPDYYHPVNLYEYMWFDAAKAKRLEEAKAKGMPLL